MFCIKMNLSLSYVSVLVVLLIASANGRRFRRQDETTPAPAPGPEPGPAPAGGAAKCFKCTGYEKCAQNLTEMDCSTQSIGNLSLESDEKAFWDIASKNQSDINDPTKFTHCIMVFWGGAEFRGCAPEKVGDKGICDYLQDVGKEASGRNINCTVCLPEGGKPCNNANATYQSGGPGGEAKKGGAEKVSYDFIPYVVSAILFKLMM